MRIPKTIKGKGLSLFLVFVISAKAENHGDENFRIQFESDSGAGNVVLVPQAGSPKAPKIARAKYQAPGLGRLVLEFIDEGVVRLEWSPKQDLPGDSENIFKSPMVDEKIHPGTKSLQVKGNSFETADIRVDVDPKTLEVTLFDKRKNKILSKVKPDDMKNDYKFLRIDNSALNDPEINGLAQSLRDTTAIDSGWKHQNVFAAGKFGNAMQPYEGGAPTYNQMPIAFFHQGELNYGMFVDNPLKTEWFTETGNNCRVGMWGDYPRMYLIAGSNLPEVHQRFMKLQGLPNVPTKSIFGWGVSKFGYRNWNEVFNDLRDLEAKGIPLPRQIYLDLQWFGETSRDREHPRESDRLPSKMGSVKFDTRNEAFPHPEETIRFLQERGIEIVPIHESYVDQGIGDYHLMRDKGYFVRTPDLKASNFLDPHNDFWKWKGGMVDWTNPEARKYWCDTRIVPLHDMGIHTYWLDLGDPEMYDPDAKFLATDGQGHNHGDNHNLYNNYWVKMIEECYERHGFKERPITMSRAMTLGRKGMNWSGDISNTPKSLNAHLKAGLDTSWAGQNYLSSDVGGFWRRDTNPKFGQLYTRWLAHSAWTDIPFRVHAHDLYDNNEYLPSKIGEIDSNRAIIKEREALIPYFYSLAWNAHLTGSPIKSAPAFYYQNDPAIKGQSEIIIGNKDLVLAASTNYDENSRNVRLPEGNRWVNYETHQVFEGGQTLNNVSTRTKAGLFQPPLFARAGAIFPRNNDPRPALQQEAKNIPVPSDDLVLRVFPDSAPGNFLYYEDDGLTRPELENKLRTTAISQKRVGNSLTVTIEGTKGALDGAPQERNQIIEFATADLNVESASLGNGTQLTRSFDKGDFKNWKQGYFVDNDAKMIIVKTGNQRLTQLKTILVKLK